MIQIYTGEGKGKTTAAMGLTMRALGHGMKVCIVQFFKNKNYYGEQKMFSKFRNLKFISFAQKHPCFYKNVNVRDIKDECRKALKKIESIIRSNKYDMLVLDELNIALHDGFIETGDVLNILKNKPRDLEIVITGRGAPKQLLKTADMVSEIKKIKHPYRKKLKSRKGIEF